MRGRTPERTGRTIEASSGVVSGHEPIVIGEIGAIDSRSGILQTHKSTILAKSISKVHPVDQDDATPEPVHVRSKHPNIPAPGRAITDSRRVSYLSCLPDAIFFICPDCSLIQCSAILVGLILTIILVIAFLYAGNYWRKG